MTRARKIRIAMLAAAAAVLAVPIVAPLLVDLDHLKAPAEAKLTQALGRRVALGDLSLWLWTGVAVRAASVTVGQPAVVTTGPATVHVAWRPLLSGRIDVRSVSVRDVALVQNGRVLVSDVHVHSRLQALPGGVVEIRDLRADAGPLSVSAAGRASQLDERKPRLALSGSARLARTTVDGRVEVVAGPPGTTASFEVGSPLFDLDEVFAAVGAASASARKSRAAAASGWLAPAARAGEPSPAPAPAAASQARSMTAHGTVRAERCIARGLEMTGLSMQVSMENGLATLRDITFALYGGRSEGSATVRPFAAGAPFSIDQRASGVAIGPMIAALAPKQAGTVEGTASLSARLSGDASGTTVLPSISGAGDLAIVDGRVASIGVIKQVMQALTIAGAAGVERDETPFDHLSAHFDVAQGVASTKNLEFRSADLDADGTGTVGLGGALRLDVLASFSQRVSAALVAKTKALSVRLGNDGRLSVPLLLRGTIQDPRLQLDLNRVLSEGVVKELKKEGTRSLLKKLLKR